MRTRPTTTRLIGSLLSGLAASVALGDVFVVDDNPGLGVDFNRIQDAVNAAQDGDKIMVNTTMASAKGAIGKCPSFVDRNRSEVHPICDISNGINMRNRGT